MREITPDPFKVFTLDELEPAARKRAIETVAEKLGGDWWDESNNESISDTIVYALAEAFKTPGWDTFGAGDFPGIPGVKLDGWDLDRGDSLTLSGTLTRENAPALPWDDTVEEVHLAATRWNGTSVGVVTVDDRTDVDVRAIDEAVRDAIEAAKRAGREEMAYMSSEEYATEEIEANGREFYADGSLY